MFKIMKTGGQPGSMMVEFMCSASVARVHRFGSQAQTTHHLSSHAVAGVPHIKWRKTGTDVSSGLDSSTRGCPPRVPCVYFPGLLMFFYSRIFCLFSSNDHKMLSTISSSWFPLSLSVSFLPQSSSSDVCKGA